MALAFLPSAVRGQEVRDPVLARLDSAGLTPVFARVRTDTPLRYDPRPEAQIIRAARAGEVLQLATLDSAGVVVHGTDQTGATPIDFNALASDFDLTQEQRDHLLANREPYIDAILDEGVRAVRRLRETMDRLPEVVVDGVDHFSSYGSHGVEIAFSNLDDDGQTIKYAWFTLRPYNPVGDRATDLRGESEITVRAVGPIEQSVLESSVFTFDHLWYEGVISCVKLTRVRIEYMNGRQRSWGRDLQSILGFPNDCSYAAQQDE